MSVEETAAVSRLLPNALVLTAFWLQFKQSFKMQSSFSENFTYTLFKNYPKSLISREKKIASGARYFRPKFAIKKKNKKGNHDFFFLFSNFSPIFFNVEKVKISKIRPFVNIYQTM